MCEYYFTPPSSHIAGLHYDFDIIELFDYLLFSDFSSFFFHLLLSAIHLLAHYFISKYVRDFHYFLSFSGFELGLTELEVLVYYLRDSLINHRRSSGLTAI